MTKRKKSSFIQTSTWQLLLQTWNTTKTASQPFWTWVSKYATSTVEMPWARASNKYIVLLNTYFYAILSGSHPGGPRGAGGEHGTASARGVHAARATIPPTFYPGATGSWQTGVRLHHQVYGKSRRLPQVLWQWWVHKNIFMAGLHGASSCLTSRQLIGLSTAELLGASSSSSGRISCLHNTYTVAAA